MLLAVLRRCPENLLPAQTDVASGTKPRCLATSDYVDDVPVFAVVRQRMAPTAMLTGRGIRRDARFGVVDERREAIESSREDVGISRVVSGGPLTGRGAQGRT